MRSRQISVLEIDLSIIITAHSEGILLHKTLASVRRAVQPLKDAHINAEIIIHTDNPSLTTREYIRVHKKQLSDVCLYINHFGDLGTARNFAVQHAHGRYVTFIDADDLMSSKWLIQAYQFLEAHEFGKFIAHTEFTLEFGSIDALVIKHGEINKDVDTLLSVFANRWNSIIMAPRKLLLEEPYAPNSPGFGYEDWHLNCRIINRGIHNVLISKSAIFVRRKDTASEWLRQRASNSVLHANPLLSFDNIRRIKTPSSMKFESGSAPFHQSMKHRAKVVALRILHKAPHIEYLVRLVYAHLRHRKANAHRFEVPTWLVKEWRAMHEIEKQLFPSEQLLHDMTVYDSLTPEHYWTGSAYKQLVDHTTKDHYDYIIFVPWLIHGGADLVCLNYANHIKRIAPHKNILVIATLPVESTWSKRLENVDFVPFGLVAANCSTEVKFRLLEQFIENSGAEYLHIINSEQAYDFIDAHSQYIDATKKKLIVTSFSQSIDDTGKVFGYSHTHVPKVYDHVTAITTDNDAVVKMWINEYGLDPAKLFVHHQPVDMTAKTTTLLPNTQGKLRVLWAARLSPEKQPAILIHIGTLLQGQNIDIDMYGTADTGFDTSFLQSLPYNVHYKGPFNGFFTLPLQDYDAYLYTSLFDGMPNAVLEAAAARLPIISSSVGGVPELISSGQSGLLINDLRNPKSYADAILELYEQPDLLNSFRDHLYNQLQSHYSIDEYGRQIKEFLDVIGFVSINEQ